MAAHFLEASRRGSLSSAKAESCMTGCGHGNDILCGISHWQEASHRSHPHWRGGAGTGCSPGQETAGSSQNCRAQEPPLVYCTHPQYLWKTEKRILYTNGEAALLLGGDLALFPPAHTLGGLEVAQHKALPLICFSPSVYLRAERPHGKHRSGICPAPSLRPIIIPVFLGTQ